MDFPSYPMCPNCGVPTLRDRYGFCGEAQRFRCRGCARTYVNGDGRAYEAETRGRALAAMEAGDSVRAVAAAMDIAVSTLARWRKSDKNSQGNSSAPQIVTALAVPVAAPAIARALPPEIPPIVRAAIQPPVQSPPKSSVKSVVTHPPAQSAPRGDAWTALESGGVVSVADLMRGD